MNVWKDGRICLNILNPNDGTWHGQWKPSITIKEILMAVQELLDNPNPSSPADPVIWRLFKTNRTAYVNDLTSRVMTRVAISNRGCVLYTCACIT